MLRYNSCNIFSLFLFKHLPSLPVAKEEKEEKIFIGGSKRFSGY